MLWRASKIPNLNYLIIYSHAKELILIMFYLWFNFLSMTYSYYKGLLDILRGTTLSLKEGTCTRVHKTKFQKICQPLYEKLL